MAAIESILVATDFSTDAEHAARRAGRIARTLGCVRGTLAHVQEPEPLAALAKLLGGSAPASKDVEVMLGERLEAIAEAVAREHGFRMKCEVVPGRAPAQLQRLAREHDLLLLGARGSHQLRERFIGSLPQRLLGLTPRPLLVVRRPPDADYGPVLVGIDFSADCRRALQWAAAIAPEAPLHLLHVFRPTRELAMHYANVTPGLMAEYRQKAGQRSEAELLRFIASTGVPADRVSSSVDEGDPAMALVRRAAEVGAGLIVVGKRGTSEVEDLLLGSVVQRLLAEADCDLLVTSHRG